MYPNPRPEAFISLTSELIPEGEAVETELGADFSTFLYIKRGSQGTPPLKVLERRIAQIDVFILLIGRRYGSVVQEDGRGAVEWEFDTAHERAKKGELEMMGFIPKPPKNETTEPSQAAFIDKVTSFRDGIWCNSYKDSVELVDAVQRSVKQWLLRFREQAIVRRFKIIRLADRVVISFAGISMGVFLATWICLGPSLSLCLATGCVLAACLTVFCLLRKSVRL